MQNRTYAKFVFEFEFGLFSVADRNSSSTPYWPCKVRPVDFGIFIF